MSYLCQQVTAFVSEIKHVENCPGFEDFLTHAIQHGLEVVIVKNMEVESTQANDLSHILKKRVCCVNVTNCFTNLSR